ncbi:hypothetical protein CAEBREN_19228 [Caenorhabditis brenneri]|uniref:Uncharacterized protein n=1 Tax=Caenorhabditis brenneri TaxID=135651 RepID=G0N590_CAEBE|nr:hypothetical protein CAEBREN_19228 [Caenorhabditis brenneri]
MEQEDVVKSFQDDSPNDLKRCQKKKREKVIYLRTFPISRLEKNSHFFTKDLREMLPLIMERQSVSLSHLKLKKWEQMLNNAYTIDREQLDKIFSDLGISEGAVTIVTDPTYLCYKWWFEAPKVNVVCIYDAYEAFYFKRHAVFLIIGSLIVGINWKDVPCGDVNCLSSYRKSVESLIRKINNSEFTFFRQTALATEISNLQQVCAYETQAHTRSKFGKDSNVGHLPEISHTDYRKVCLDHHLPSYNENESPLPVWRAKYLWFKGYLEIFNPDVKYLKMLQNGFIDNVPKEMVDVFMEENSLAVERTPQTTIEFPNGMATFMDLFFRKERESVKTPMIEGDCPRCLRNVNLKNQAVSEKLQCQKNMKIYEEKMKAANDSREKHLEQRTEAENKAKRYEEKALKTIAVEKKSKEKDSELKQLRKQVNNQNNQSAVIESLKEETEQQKKDLKSLKDTNKTLTYENKKHIEEKTRLSETVENLGKDLVNSNIKNEILCKENGSLIQSIEHYSQVLEGQKKCNDDLDMAHQQTNTNLVGECKELSSTLEKTQVELEETKNQVRDLEIERNALTAQAKLDQHDINSYKQKVNHLLVEKQLVTTQFAKEKAQTQVENENLQVVNKVLVEKVKRLEYLLKQHGIVDSSVGAQGSE